MKAQTKPPPIAFQAPEPILLAAVLQRINRVTKAMGKPATGDQIVSVLLDLCAANGCNGNPPLDFTNLLGIDRASFLGALNTIMAHMDRRTGELMPEPYKPTEGAAR